MTIEQSLNKVIVPRSPISDWHFVVILRNACCWCRLHPNTRNPLRRIKHSDGLLLLLRNVKQIEFPNSFV